MSHVRTIEIPSIPAGPVGVPAEHADAAYYRDAAASIRWHFHYGTSFAGSNLTETVAKLCETAAQALEGDPS